MKKLVKVLLASAVGMALSCGLAFAQTSNTNTVTMGLLEDNIADKLDTGNDANDVLFLGAYDSNRINLGFGKFFGDGLWISLFDSYYLNGSNPTKTTTVTNTSHSSDGMNTDYTDTVKNASVSGYSYLLNTLDYSMFFNNEKGFTLEWNTQTYFYKGYGADPTAALTATSGASATSEDSSITATGVSSSTKYSKLNNISSTNTYKVKFNGIKMDETGDKNFYLQLNNVSFKHYNRLINLAYTKETKLNGSTQDGGTQPKYNGKYNYNTFTPGLEFETGLTMNTLWDVVSPKFILVDSFTMAFKHNTNTYSYTTLTTNTAAQTVTEVVDYAYHPGKYLDWSNSLTPRFDFDIDLGERFSLKARAQAEITLGGTKDYAAKTTRTTTTTTVDNITGVKTVSKEFTEQGSANQNEDIFKTSVSPKFSFGLVYQLLPGKLNLNLGASANSGLFSWTITTEKNNHIPTISKTTQTNEFGESYVSAYTYTATGNGSPETKSVAFASSTPSANANLGFTWFLSDHAQLDTVLLTGLSASWQLKIQLGLCF